MKINIYIYACSLALAACSSTATDRYGQLMKKDKKDCAANVDVLQFTPAKELIIGTPSEGELDADHCLILKTGERVSYEIYEFMASTNSHSLDVLSFIKARGLGFGGENTVVWPMAILQKEGSDILEIQPPSIKKSQWIRNVWSGDQLKTTFTFQGLTLKSKYRLIITSTIGEMGKEIPGYHSTVAAGRIVIGPLGKTELNLH